MFRPKRLSGITHQFPRGYSGPKEHVTYAVFLGRHVSPCGFSLDLHATIPPTFILSQDQTLHNVRFYSEPRVPGKGMQRQYRSQ